MSVRKYEGAQGVRWQWRVSYRDASGQRRTQSGTERTQKLAKTAEREAWERLRGGVVVDAKMTVAEFIERYLAARASSDLRASSLHGYAERFRSHVTPYLGNVRLVKLTPLMLEDWKATMLNHRPDGKPLNPNTLRTTMSIFSTALNYAVRWKVLTANPFDGCDLPRSHPAPQRIWTPDQARTFLAATRTEPCGPMWQLALLLGMRLGELCGLRWGSVDLARGWLTIKDVRTQTYNRTFDEAKPKSYASQRDLPLPPPILAILVDLRERRDIQRAADPTWNPEDFVFERGDGEGWQPAIARTHFDRSVARLGLPDISPHDCRHTAATLLIDLGVDPKVVSQILGHTSVTMTYRYVHPGDHDKRAAIDRLWSVIESGGTETVQKSDNVVPIRPVSQGERRKR